MWEVANVLRVVWPHARNSKTSTATPATRPLMLRCPGTLALPWSPKPGERHLDPTKSDRLRLGPV